MKDASSKFFIIGLILTAIISLVSIFSGLTLANLKLFDHFSNYSSLADSETGLLIITRDQLVDQKVSEVISDNSLRTTSNFTAIEELVKQLQAYKAKAIVFVSESNRNYLPKFQNTDNVYIATPFKSRFTASPKSNHIKNIATIPIYSDSGVVRQYSPNNNDENLISLFMSANDQPITTSSFDKRYFNIFIRPELFPNLTFSQSTQGNLVEALVREKIVLIELEESSYFSGFIVPGGLKNKSFVELQAILLKSNNQNLDLVDLPAIFSVLLLLVVFCLNFILLQVLSARGIVLNLILTTVIIYASSFALMLYFQLILPAIELECILILSLIYFLSAEREIEEKLVHQVTANINSRLAKRIKPDDFNETSQPWPKLHSLINHHLMLQRSIFLEKLSDGSHVKEIDAFNCSIDDIKERRRDFKREPYLSAVEKKIPIKMTKKDYFYNVQTFESQYIVALEFAGELLGFWAFTVNHEELDDIQQFEVQVLSFSVELSGLLYQRSKFLISKERRSNLIHRFIGLEVAQQEFSKLNSSISAFEKRHDILQEIFNGMSSAAVLFDLFGQLVIFNRAAENLSAEYSVSLYSLTAHDLLLILTRQPVEKVKQTMKRVTTLGEEVDFQISQGKGASNYMLKIRAIKANKAESDLSNPFLVMGILFEFINVESVQNIIERKKDLFTKHAYQINNSLSCISLLVRRLKKQEAEKQAQTIRLIDESIIEATQLQKKVEESLFNFQSTEKVVQVFDVVPLIKSILEKIKKKFSSDDLVVSFNAPKIISLALSRPDEFSCLVEDVLKLLLTDSLQQDSSLTIDISDREQTESKQRELILRFKNRGFGLPEDELNNIKKSIPSDISDTNYIGNVLLRSRQLKTFNVNCQLTSDIGVGFEVVITLPAFETD
jgi:CHASE2 domain-containing sensor protein